MAFIAAVLGWIVAIIFLAYLVPHTFVAWFYKTQNLKKKYHAQWALVTGASSGAELRGGGVWEPACHVHLDPDQCGALSTAGHLAAVQALARPWRRSWLPRA